MRAEHREDGYRPALRVIERGRVSSVGDGIVWIEGLPSARMDGIVHIDDGSQALVVHLTARRIGARSGTAGIDAASRPSRAIDTTGPKKPRS